MVQPAKMEKVEELKRLIQESKSVILNDFTGLNVADISELRRQCHENSIDFRVVKNTLARRSFDELGIDCLMVDEIHEFKNLSYNSTMDRNPGMGNPNGSAKAFDMFVKVRWLFDTFGDKTPFITATGTPVSNSLVEMYNMQRYMQYPTLKQERLHVF
ncbi:MAG: 50S ribosomal protein L10, partial [Chrysiogenales bacterium]